MRKRGLTAEDVEPGVCRHDNHRSSRGPIASASRAQVAQDRCDLHVSVEMEDSGHSRPGVAELSRHCPESSALAVSDHLIRPSQLSRQEVEEFHAQLNNGSVAGVKLEKRSGEQLEVIIEPRPRAGGGRDA